jgi:hypothetical protein
LRELETTAMGRRALKESIFEHAYVTALLERTAKT